METVEHYLGVRMGITVHSGNVEEQSLGRVVVKLQTSKEMLAQ